MTPRDDDGFLDEAVARGLVTPAQAADCRRVLEALSEVEVALTPDDVLDRKGILSRERSAELRRALASRRVGRYEVLERLGQGGSGVVWKARDTVLDRIVALKLLSPGARDDAGWRERFLREARTAVTLNHAGIVRGLDCGEADGYVWFAMEFVPGESAGAKLRREGRLPEREAVRIALEVARVLRHIAAEGLAHRDLKPDNILLAPDGRVKVCDLGLAKPTREAADLGERDPGIAGTPLYVAPEQIRDGDRVDWRADVYSLGATLYHLLAGRPPFPWEKGRDLLARHLNEVPPSPREFALDVSPNAAAVVLKMLQKDPADRYARIEDLEADLEAVLAGRAPLHTVSFAPRERPAVDVAAARAAGSQRRRPWLVGATAAAVLVALGGVTAYAILRHAESLRSRGGSPSGTPPAAPQSPRVPAPAPAAPSAVVKPPPDTPAEADARTALETARRFALEHPEDLRATEQAFRFVAEQHAGTLAADVARGLVADLLREIERGAAEALAATRVRAADLEADGRLGDAIAAYDAVVAAHSGTAAADGAAAELRRLRDEADRRLRLLLDETRDLVAAADFAGARQRLESAAALGLPWAGGVLAQRVREVEESAAEFERARTAARPAFDRLWGTVVLAAGEKGVEDALTLLDAGTAEVAPWTRELDALRLDLLSMPRTPPATTIGLRTLDLRGAFFARLTRRDLAGAEATLAPLAAAGGRAEELRAGLARVRSVLAATADEILALAEDARAAKRFADAERLVARALAEVPRYDRARVAAAALLADRGNAAAAVAELEDVLAQPAAPPEAHLRLGQILAARGPEGDADRARHEVELYLSLAGERAPLRAEARGTLETLAARRAAARLVELRAQLRESRDPVRTATVARAILTLDPADTSALVQLAEALAATSEPHEAWLAFRRVADPADRNWSRAAEGLRRLEQRFAAAPGDRDAALAARALLAEGDLAGARTAIDDLLRRAPFLEDALVCGAEAWLARKGHGAYAIRDVPARALLLADVLTQRNPQSVRGAELRAEALLRCGLPKEALEIARRCAEEDPVRPDPATTAGFAALALDDPSDALSWFKMSTTRLQTPAAFYGRALAWEALGRRQTARDEALVLLETFGVPDALHDEVTALLARLDLEPADTPR